MNKLQRFQKTITEHSFHIAALLLVLAIGGTIGIGLIVNQNYPPLRAFDAFLYEAINHGPHPRWLNALVYPFRFNFLPWGSPSPVYFIFWAAMFFAYIFVKKRSLFIWAALSLALGHWLVYQLTIFNWHFVSRERPFLSLPSTIDEIGYTVLKGLPSYPSGHVRDTALYATIMTYYIPKLKWPMILFTTFIAWSRVYTGDHFPTDTMGGALMGYLTARVVLMIMRDVQVIIDRLRGKEVKGDEYSDRPKGKKEN